MIAAVASRIAILAVFLALQILVFFLELLIFVSSVTLHSWYIPLRQWVAPAGFALLGVVIAPVAFTGLDVNSTGLSSECPAGVDADVAGDGVRIAVWVQVTVLVAIVTMGSFHLKATGAKEVGAGLVLTHISLAIAILVQLRRRTLSPADAAAGTIILDAQNMALSIQLAAKETLAARWQVSIVILVQLFGLVLIPVLASNLFMGSFAAEDCTCVTVFWWAWLSNCLPAWRQPEEQSVFWIYYTMRCVSFAQAAFHAVFNTQTFHEAEPKCGDEGTEEQKMGGALVGITYPYIKSSGGGLTADSKDGQVARFGEYPATITFMYGIYGVYAIASLGAIEGSMRDLGLRPTSGVDSIGQIIALVIAGATTLRAGWLFGKLFTDEWRSSRELGFVWPFHVPQSTLRLMATFLLPPSFDFPPDFIELGTILSDPHDLIKLDKDPSVPIPADIAIWSHDENFVLGLPSSSSTASSILRSILAFARLGLPRSSEVHVTVDRLETRQFTPTSDYIEQRVKEPSIAQYITGGNVRMGKQVFMVTGIKIAHGAVTIPGPIEGPGGIALASGAWTRETVIERRHEVQIPDYEQGFLLAYQLVAITVRRDLTVADVRRYTRGALL
ncbi:hypothetical protein QBC34DRAFT_308596 [Podospora aff. communis PSN243]|uniref:Uncharacterized protein n=1 Tax=Podospora aff. communis PSN243 TaxID=3040156 RepID=A0AAV9GBA0_9PEZI|nr:hypothetical protein QBC34DRAFT_308596 [Podospora aff. communis PSN243]